MYSIAGSTNQNDLATLARLRGSLPADEWNKFQAGAVTRLGTENGVFNESTFLRNFNEMPAANRNLVFGGPKGNDLLEHLNEIAKSSQRAEEYANRNVGLRAAAALGNFTTSTLSLISRLSGNKTLSQVLSNTASAASAARLSKAYEGILRSSSPTNRAIFDRATKDFLSNLPGVEETIKNNVPDVTLELPPLNIPESVSAIPGMLSSAAGKLSLPTSEIPGMTAPRTLGDLPRINPFPTP